VVVNVLTPLRIYTLGRLSVLHGDQPVSGFISRKVEALLVYLAYERREHPREVLAELLWSELPQARAMGNLRTVLSNLQSQLAEYLIITRQYVRINPEGGLWLDALELEKALHLAEGELTNAALQTFDRALELYQGDFLAGFYVREAGTFEEWRMLQAERLRAKMAEALHHVVDDTLKRGNYTSGVDYARRLLTLDPLSEEAHRSLMRLLARSGQRNAALSQYETCVRLLREELDVAPEAETTRLFAEIQTQQLAEFSRTSPQGPVIRIPIPATPFVERPGELQHILGRLDDPNSRLITIAGPGGIGKTRLAIHSAMERASAFRDGVFFVSLAAVQSGDFLPLEIGDILGFAFKGGRTPREELVNYLAGREILLVLDNFEHLVGDSGLLLEILGRAPHVKILVTSREWLNVQQEWIVSIDGMAYPPSHAVEAEAYDAVQLFMACARRIRPRFSLDDDRKAVVEICRLVEGIPLSIELAATWLRVIPPAEIVRQINLKFLSTTARNVPERHRNMEAVFDYSWRLLSPDEVRALMRLSVFKGHFDRAAAAEVAGAILPVLASLVEKSLIRLVDDHYYDMHDLMRQFAFAKLAEVDRAVATRDAHLNYYVQFTSDPDSRVHGQKQTEWLDRLEQEHDNLRTAIGWALDHDTEAAREAGLEIGASLWEFWLMRGHISEGRQWLDRLLSATMGMVNKARGVVTQGAGYLAWIQGEHDRAEALHHEGLAIRRALDDKAGMGGSLSNLGVIAWSRGDFQAARDYYEQALAVRREAGYKLGTASVLTNLSLLLQDQGEYEEAITYAEQALSLFTDLDDLQGKSNVLFNLGSMAYDRGYWEQARSIHEEALVLSRSLGDRRVIGALLQNLGQTALSLGDGALAHTYLDESLRLINDVGDKTQLGLVKKTMARMAIYETRLDDAQALINESMNIFRDVDNQMYLGQTLIVQGDLYRTRSMWNEAAGMYENALAILLKVKNRQPVVDALYRSAVVAFEQLQTGRALTLLSAADALADRLSIVVPDKPSLFDRELLRTRLTDAEVENAMRSGATMSFASLVEYVGVRTST